MKAIAVHPGKPGSLHLADLPEPSLDEVQGGRGVLARVLRVGVDGTDREINSGEYGAAPEGGDFLVLGHESFCERQARASSDDRMYAELPRRRRRPRGISAAAGAVVGGGVPSTPLPVYPA